MRGRKRNREFNFKVAHEEEREDIYRMQLYERMILRMYLPTREMTLPICVCMCSYVFASTSVCVHK